MSYRWAAFWLLQLALVTAVAAQESSNEAVPIGRWDVTVFSGDQSYPSWFEVRRSGYRSLVGSYVGQFGSARPIGEVHFENGELRFQVPPQWERRETDIEFTGLLKGDTLRGETTDDEGNTVRWEARRAPDLDSDYSPQWDAPVELMNGRDLSGWKPRHPDVENGWTVKDGILVNANPGVDLVTEQTFNDFQLHAEFRYPPRSNSGIYLRGRYEAQIEDNFGQEADCHRIGGVYGFLTPAINAARPAGEWQTLEITLIGRRVTIVLNGERVVDRQIIPGITGGALDSDEGAPGPLMIQGDHGPVEFRKLTIVPASNSPNASAKH